MNTSGGGAIHFHAIIRLDAAPPADDPEAVAPPPAECTVEVLEKAVRAVRDSAVVSCPELAALGRSDTSIRWGMPSTFDPYEAVVRAN